MNAAPIACLSPSRRLALAASAEIVARGARGRLEPFSLSGYLSAPSPPKRLVLCPSGCSLAADLRFLRRAALRLLWPPPQAGFHEAIAAIRAPARRRPRARGRGRAASAIAVALLLEGPVGLARARAALAASATRDWIVETATRVRISDDALRALARAGVRWAALEPVEVVGLYASPALARARAQWRPLLPKRTAVWIRRY